MLTYYTVLDKPKNTLIVRVTGTASNEENKRVGVEFRRLAQKGGNNLIIDARKMDLSHFTYLDIDLIFKEHFDKIDPSFRDIPTVILLDKKDEQKGRFVELAWRADGIKTTWARNEEEAYVLFSKL